MIGIVAMSSREELLAYTKLDNGLRLPPFDGEDEAEGRFVQGLS